MIEPFRKTPLSEKLNIQVSLLTKYWPTIEQGLAFLVFLVLVRSLILSNIFNSIYYNDAGISLCMISFAMWIYVLIRTRKVIYLPILICGLGFIALSWLSFYLSETKNVGLTEILFDNALILLIFSLPYFLRIAKKWSVILFSLILSLGVAQAFWAFNQYLIRTETRAAGFFFSPDYISHYYPNAFALSSIFFLALGLGFLFKKNLVWQWFGGISSMAILAGLFLSWSRGGILAVIGIGVLSLGIIVFRHKSWRGLLKLIIIFLLGGGLAFGLNHKRAELEFSVNDVTEKAQFSGTEGQTSVNERKEFMIHGVQLAQQKPLLGYGPGSFEFVEKTKQEFWLAAAPHSHNWLIKVASERGLITMGLFLAFWLFVLGKYFKNWKSYSEFSNWVFIGILAALGHNLIDFNFNFASNILLLAFLTSILIAEMDFNPISKKLWLSFCILTAFFPVTIYRSANAIDRIKQWENPIKPLSEIWHEIEQQHFFKGNAYVSLANKATVEKDFPLVEKSLKAHLKLNQYDANAWNFLGLTYFSEKNYTPALEAFEKALELDDKNNWEYYLNVIKTLELLGNLEKLKGLSEGYIKNLEAYLPMVKANVHYTAQKQNSLWAFDTITILEKYVSPETRTRLIKIKTEIETARAHFKK